METDRLEEVSGWRQEAPEGRREMGEVAVWHLKCSANHGSDHYDEHPLGIAAARLGNGGRRVTLEIPTLAPTRW